MDLVMQDTSSEVSLDISQYDSLSVSPNDRPGVSPPRDQGEKRNALEMKKRGRKGRTKSRAGCFNCKRARLKCKENRPICDYCLHRDLNCEWPDIQINHTGALVQKRVSQPVPFLSMNSQSSLPVFTMQDFRLFNHFIQNAYPHQPIGNDAIWKQEIPSIASEYTYLLHSMLALSASDLVAGKEQTPDGSQLMSAALAHRVKAISALNDAITVGIDCFEQGNAMLATCFVLLFQSTLIDDGLVEYMTFLRGTVAVSIQMGCNRLKFLFENLFGDQSFKKVDEAISSTPLIKPDVVAAACQSFKRFSHMCQSKIEVEVYTILFGIARSLITSSRDAYLNLTQMYKLFSYTMPPDDFREFINPKNEVCKLLQSHFIALQLIMTPITSKEWAGRENPTESHEGMTGRWLIGLHRNILPCMLKYYEWTMWVQQEVYYGRIYNGKYLESHTVEGEKDDDVLTLL